MTILNGRFINAALKSLSPFSADYHTNLMRFYLAVGRAEQAVAEAHRAAALSRYSAAKKADLAAACLAVGKYPEAADYARQAVEAARGYLEAALRKGWRINPMPPFIEGNVADKARPGGHLGFAPGGFKVVKHVIINKVPFME